MAERKRPVVTTNAAFSQLDMAIVFSAEAPPELQAQRWAEVMQTVDRLIDNEVMRLEDAALSLSIGLRIPQADLIEDLRRRQVSRGHLLS